MENNPCVCVFGRRYLTAYSSKAFEIKGRTALQIQKAHANRKSTSKSRKHLHQFDSRCCKCSQHKQIKKRTANAHNTKIKKRTANRKSTSKSRKHLHQFDSRCCKCTQHNQITKRTANAHNTKKKIRTANRKSTSKSRKHLHQFDSRCCKCSQHKQIKIFFIWLCCEHLQCVNLQVFFSICSALSSLGHRTKDVYTNWVIKVETEEVC